VIHFGNFSNGEGRNRRSYRFDRRAPHSILISTAEKALPKMSLSSSAPPAVVVYIDASIFPSLDAVAEQPGIGSTADSDACDALTRDVASL
jgi:hypothetical protein